MARRHNPGRVGAVSGNVAGIPGTHSQDLIYSDPSGLFDFVGGIVDQGKKAAEEAAAAARRAAEEAAAAARRVAEQAAAAAQRAAEEQARKVAEAAAAARRVAEEQARRVAEQAAAARRAAEEQARQVAAAAQRAAEEQARRVAEQVAAAQRVAEEQARRVAEQVAAAQRAAEEQARRVAEQAAATKRAAEEQAAAARRVAEEQAAAVRRAAEEQAKNVVSVVTPPKTSPSTSAPSTPSVQPTVLIPDVVGIVGGAVGGIVDVIQETASKAPGVVTGVVQTTTSVAGNAAKAAAEAAAATAAAVAAAEQRAREMTAAAEQRALEERDRMAREFAAQLAAAEAVVKPTFGVIGSAQGIIAGATTGAVQEVAKAPGAVAQTIKELHEASAADLVKGVGDVIANVPTQGIAEITTGMWDGYVGLTTGRQVSDAERQRYKDLNQAYLADAVYNVYATPGQVIDLATAAVDVADELFGSGDYERTHFGDAIKKGIFRRDEIGVDIPGSMLGYGSQYDRDVLKELAAEDYVAGVTRDYGDAAGLGALLVSGLGNAWHSAPVIEGVTFELGGALGKAAKPLASAFGIEQLVDAGGQLLLGTGNEQPPQIQPTPTSVWPGPVTGLESPPDLVISEADLTRAVASYNASHPPTTDIQTPIVDISQYEAELLAAQREMEAQYAAAQAESERQAALYQQQLDAAYAQRQAALQGEYDAAIGDYTGTAAEYEAARQAYDARQRELEAQYLAAQQAADEQYLRDQDEQARQLEEYQKQVAEYEQALRDEDARRQAEYEQALRDEDARRQAEYEAALAEYSGQTVDIGQSYPVTGGTISRTPGPLSRGTIYPRYDSYETLYDMEERGTIASQPGAVTPAGVNPALIVGVAGTALLAGIYYLSKQKPVGSPRRM